MWRIKITSNPSYTLSLIYVHICLQLAIVFEKAAFCGIIVGFKSNFLFAAAACHAALHIQEKPVITPWIHKLSYDIVGKAFLLAPVCTILDKHNSINNKLLSNILK